MLTVPTSEQIKERAWEIRQFPKRSRGSNVTTVQQGMLIGLYADVLTVIANGAESPRELASAVLEATVTIYIDNAE